MDNTRSDKIDRIQGMTFRSQADEIIFMSFVKIFPQHQDDCWQLSCAVSDSLIYIVEIEQWFVRCRWPSI